MEWSIRSADDILCQWDNLVPNSSNSSSTSPSPAIELGEKYSSRPSSAYECPRFGPKERIRQIPEEERHHSLMICWKRTIEDSFLLEFNLDSTLSPLTRLQCNNKLLGKIEIELGAWYSIEYSKYPRSATHIYIHQIVLANAQQRLTKTRIMEGDVQVRPYSYDRDIRKVFLIVL